MFGARIKHVELDEQDGVLITFSDGTFAGYVAEELLDLRPSREPTTDGTRILKYDPQLPARSFV